MTNEEKQVRDWMVAFNQEVPDKPTIPSLEVRKLRARLILEEALETIEGLGFYAVDARPKSNTDPRIYPDTRVELVEHGMPPDLVCVADGCADLMVVTLGTKAACGLLPKEYTIPGNGVFYAEGIDPIFNEVMRSNWTKLWTDEEVSTEFRAKLYLNPDFPELCYAKHPTKGWEALRQAVSGIKRWLVKDASGKVIKSPSYSPANLEQFIK